MKTMKIYFKDLNVTVRMQFVELFGDPKDMNLDVFPLFIYEQEDEEKEYCTQNNGKCETCSLVNYRRDCWNEPI